MSRVVLSPSNELHLKIKCFFFKSLVCNKICIKPFWCKVSSWHNLDFIHSFIYSFSVSFLFCSRLWWFYNSNRPCHSIIYNFTVTPNPVVFYSLQYHQVFGHCSWSLWKVQKTDCHVIFFCQSFTFQFKLYQWFIITPFAYVHHVNFF